MTTSTDNASPQGNSFAAELLERSASGFAGYAASVMLEKAPEIKARYEPDAFGNWKTHLTQRILELAAAVNTAEPLMFSARVLWSCKAFRARGREEDDLVISLSALKDVLTDHLPAAASKQPIDYVQRAMDTLSEGRPDVDESELDPEQPHDRMALRYLQGVLEGNAAAAIKEVMSQLDQGMTPMEIYVNVLIPAQREIGRLWHLGDASIAEEHMVTSTTQRAMSALAISAEPSAANGKTILAAAVTGNVHDIGLRAVADAFQMSGWRTIYLGSDVPALELPANLTFFEADLLLLSATLSTQLPRIRHTIQSVRERSERPVKILVGGAAFDEAPEVWRKVGADGYGDSIDGAVKEGARLVGL
jgi:methanogenic corrinoid protein MtbC1